jgi:hypothetical protein
MVAFAKEQCAGSVPRKRNEVDMNLSSWMENVTPCDDGRKPHNVVSPSSSPNVSTLSHSPWSSNSRKIVALGKEKEMSSLSQ